MDVNFTSRGLSVLLASALSLSIPVAAYSQGVIRRNRLPLKASKERSFYVDK